MENQLPVKRIPYSPEEKQQLIWQWKQSGLSRQAFCRQNNLNYHTLINWTGKKGSGRKIGSAEPDSFIPLQVKPSAEKIFAQIESGSKRIHLYYPVPASFLKQLLR